MAASEDELLERADWSRRSPEFGALSDYMSRHGEAMVVMGMLAPAGSDPAIYEPLWCLWIALPPYPHILEAVGIDPGQLLVRYAAIDWGHQPARVDGASEKIATWGVELTRVFEFLSVCVSEADLGWFACPIVKLDLEGEIRVGFVSAAAGPSEMKRVPPEVLADWPRCDERGLVFVVGQLLRSLIAIDVQTPTTPLGAVLERCLASDPDRRFATLKQLRDALVSAGATRNASAGVSQPEAWHRIEAGIGYLALQRPRRAYRYFQRALEFNPHSHLAMVGRNEAVKGGAVPTISGGLQLVPAGEVQPKAQWMLPWSAAEPDARRLEAERAFAEALTIYDAVRPDDANRAALYTAKARCHLHLGESGNAIDDAQRALDVDPARIEAHAIRANGFLMKKRHRDALSATDSWLGVDAGDGVAHYVRGKALIGLGRLVEARESFDRAFTLDPKLLEAMLLRREVDRSLRGIRSTAGTQAKQALEVPSHLAKLGAIVMSGHAREAIEVLQTSEYDRDPVAQLMLASCYVFEQRFEEALTVYVRVRALADEHRHAATVGMAGVLLELDRAEEALQHFETARADQPDDLDALEGQAKALALLGRTTEADEAFRRYVAVAGRRSERRVHTAQLWFATRA